MNEASIQKSIVQYLRTVLPPAYRVTALPNASRRTASGRASNAVAGLSPGLPDLAIIGGGTCWFLEVKAPAGRLSAHQQEWKDFLLFKAFVGFAVVHSIDEVKTALRLWSIPTREAA